MNVIVSNNSQVGRPRHNNISIIILIKSIICPLAHGT